MILEHARKKRAQKHLPLDPCDISWADALHCTWQDLVMAYHDHALCKELGRISSQYAARADISAHPCSRDFACFMQEIVQTIPNIVTRPAGRGEGGHLSHGTRKELLLLA